MGLQDHKMSRSESKVTSTRKVINCEDITGIFGICTCLVKACSSVADTLSILIQFVIAKGKFFPLINSRLSGLESVYVAAVHVLFTQSGYHCFLYHSIWIIMCQLCI